MSAVVVVVYAVVSCVVVSYVVVVVVYFAFVVVFVYSFVLFVFVVCETVHVEVNRHASQVAAVSCSVESSLALLPP